MDIKESTALITAAYASIQNGGKVGTGVKSMINNLAGLQTSAKDGSISLNKTAKALKEIAGIDIFTDKTQTAVKTAPQLLDEINQLDEINLVIFDTERILKGRRENLQEEYRRFMSMVNNKANEKIAHTVCVIIGIDKFI